MGRSGEVTTHWFQSHMTAAWPSPEGTRKKSVMAALILFELRPAKNREGRHLIKLF